MKTFSIFLFLFFLAHPSWAHHPGHSCSQNTNLFFQKGSTKPASLFSLSFDYSILDESLGSGFAIAGLGEYALSQRFSFLVQAPFIGLLPDEASNTIGFGDIALGSKGLLFNGKNFFLMGSLLFTLPTGKENLGRESVGINSSLFLGYTHKNWTVFFSPGVDSGFDSDSDLIADLVLGVTTPSFFRNKVYFSFSTRARVFGSSETFETGSWKMYAEPQMRFIASKRVHLGLGFKFSVIDELHLEEGVVLTGSSASIFNDVAWGMTSDITYLF